MAIDKEVLDQLLAGRDPGELFAKDGLLDELKKALSERMLSAELDDHLEGEAAPGKPNRRNGVGRNRVYPSLWIDDHHVAPRVGLGPNHPRPEFSVNI